MVRLCYTAGIDIKIECKNGQLVTEGPGSENQRMAIMFALEFANFSQFATVKTNDDCIERFIKNESDFSTGLFHMNGLTEEYFVPVPAISSSLYFLSGYNVFKYEKELEKSQSNQFGVMDNFASFSVNVYSVIFAWIAILITLISLRTTLLRRRRQLASKSRRFFSIFIDSATGRFRKQWLLMKFSFTVGFLLLVTTFCLLFKTKQVVTRKLDVISSYDEIISSKLSPTKRRSCTRQSISMTHSFYSKGLVTMVMKL